MLNLLATPGLGSLLCGRWIAGSGQLIMAVTGFTVVAVWFVRIMVPYYGLMFSDEPPQFPNMKMLLQGAVLFAVAWLWSAVTSISLAHEASRNELDLLQKPAVPPKLSDLPKTDNQQPYV